MGNTEKGLPAAMCSGSKLSFAFSSCASGHLSTGTGSRASICTSLLQRNQSPAVPFKQGLREAFDQTSNYIGRHDGTMRRDVQWEAALQVLFLKPLRPPADDASGNLLQRRAVAGCQQVQRKASFLVIFLEGR